MWQIYGEIGYNSKCKVIWTHSIKTHKYLFSSIWIDSIIQKSFCSGFTLIQFCSTWVVVTEETSSFSCYHRNGLVWAKTKFKFFFLYWLIAFEQISSEPLSLSKLLAQIWKITDSWNDRHLKLFKPEKEEFNEALIYLDFLIELRYAIIKNAFYYKLITSCFSYWG